MIGELCHTVGRNRPITAPRSHRLLSWDFSPVFLPSDSVKTHTELKGGWSGFTLIGRPIAFIYFRCCCFFFPTLFCHPLSSMNKNGPDLKIYLPPHVHNTTVHVQLLFVCLVDTGLLFLHLICSLPQDVVYWWTVSVDERLSERMQSAKAWSAAKFISALVMLCRHQHWISSIKYSINCNINNIIL